MCLFFCAAQDENLTNVKSALFRDGVWNLNVNYLSANSPDFWHKYVLKLECESVVKFQEAYCLGKSIHVLISDMKDSSKSYNLTVNSKETFDCSSNIQDPNVAALNSRYAKGQILLPKGIYSVAMKLDNYTNVLGFRGYYVKASVPIDRIILTNKCRSRRNPNM